MNKLVISCIIVFVYNMLSAQNKTDISLKWKGSDKQETIIESDSGDLFQKLSHHGPAIENEWLAFRMYFDFKCAIDIYNKTRPGLELAAASWYPTVEQQKEGWGADQYKVGTTVGCGGVRLWDGEKVVYLNPVTKRTARVCKEANFSYMEMLSEGVPYKGDSVNILVRVTVYSGTRAAKVEAFALNDEPVQFLTGLNYHATTVTKEGKNYISTWGTHPEDVAAFQLAIGAAIIYNPDDFTSVKKFENEYQLISNPGKYLATWISAACEKEQEINTIEKFIHYLDNFKK